MLRHRVPVDDLANHGRVNLAERFIARYARAASDYDLYGLVDFYESYRALVRAKVALLGGAIAEARRHVLLALSADRRALLSPSMVAVGGIIAAGKSTLAERIGDAMSAPVIGADRRERACSASRRHRPSARPRGTARTTRP